MQVLVPDYLVDFFLPRLRAVEPTVDLIPISADGKYPRSLEGIEVMYKFYGGPIPGERPRAWGSEVMRQILKEAPKFRWIHSGTAGMEGLLIPELVESDIVVTNGAGAPKVPIAETILLYILMDAKRVIDHLAYQKQAKWQGLPHRESLELTVAILGLGAIGMEAARLCHYLGMRVIGTKRRISGEPLPNVDELYPHTQQNECVAKADYVVVAAPLTAETRGMVNSSTFAAMRRDAALINISRGGLVDQPALAEALQAGQIRMAYLDVTDPEPLPSDNVLWTLPNVVIHPHNSNNSQIHIERMTYHFLENFPRFLKGEPLVNVVDKRAGY